MPLDVNSAPPGTTPRETRLADYRPPAFLVENVELSFDLDAAATRVRSRMTVRRNAASTDPGAPLSLDGEGHILAQAQEEHLTQRLLEILDALGQRRLRDVQHLGGAREIELAREHHERFDLGGWKAARHACVPLRNDGNYNPKLSTDHPSSSS